MLVKEQYICRNLDITTKTFQVIIFPTIPLTFLFTLRNLLDLLQDKYGKLTLGTETSRYTA